MTIAYSRSRQGYTLSTLGLCSTALCFSATSSVTSALSSKLLIVLVLAAIRSSVLSLITSSRKLCDG